MFSCCCFFVAFVVLFLNVGYLSKTSLKNLEIPSTPKMKNAENKTDILTRTISTGALTNSVLCVFKFRMFADNTINIEVLAPKQTNKKNKKKKTVVLKTGPRLC